MLSAGNRNRAFYPAEFRCEVKPRHVCDEIGSDAEEVRQCMGCGVKLAVTAHAAGIDELRSRQGIAELYPLFDRAALLEGGRLTDIREIRS